MVEQGLALSPEVEFVEIIGEEGDFTIRYRQKGEAKELHVPHVLLATGRAPNVEGLGLEAAGVEHDRHGIRIDETLQMTRPHIYAVGDCTTDPKFAHWATYQAGIAAHNLFAPGKHSVEPEKLSWVLFSDPQIASAGLSEAEAKAAGM